MWYSNDISYDSKNPIILYSLNDINLYLIKCLFIFIAFNRYLSYAR